MGLQTSQVEAAVLSTLIHMKKRTTLSAARRSRRCYCLGDIGVTTVSAVPHTYWWMAVVVTLVGINPKLLENSHRIVGCPWKISSKKKRMVRVRLGN